MGNRAAFKYKQSRTADEYLNQRYKINPKTGCWDWTFCKDKDGYGQVHDARCAKEARVTRAHQLAYVAWVDKIPLNYCICHTCDNPSCVNPKHLFAGTVNDNNQDKTRKGRNISGQFPKVNYDEIYSYKGKETSFKTAERFGISFSRVCQIWREEVDFSRKPKGKGKSTPEENGSRDSEQVPELDGA